LGVNDMTSSDKATMLPDSTLDEKKLESQLVHKGLFFDVYRDKVRLPDGESSLREYIRHPGACWMTGGSFLSGSSAIP